MDERANRILNAIKGTGLSYESLQEITGIPKSALQRYATGITKKIPIDRLEKIAHATGVSATFLMGWDSSDKASVIPPGFEPPPKMRKVPLVGEIACGEPILAEQNIEDYLEIPEEVHCDFLLRGKGDSMVDAGIRNGDIVFVRIQETVENGEIAAVRIGEEATLKRVYWDGNTLTLMPANSQYAPLSFRGEEINDIHIEGKAIGYMHMF